MHLTDIFNLSFTTGVFPNPGYLYSYDGVVWLWHLLVKLHIWLTIPSCYSTIPFTLIGRGGGLSTLCYSCGFACQPKVLKTFLCSGYLCSEDGLVWLSYFLVNLYIWLTISFCHGSIHLALGLIGRDGGLSTLCHSCGFTCQQMVLKTFPGPGYLHSKDGVVWLWHLLVNLYIYTKPYNAKLTATGLNTLT